MWTENYRLFFIIAAQWLLPVALVAQVARQDTIFLQLPDGTFLLTEQPMDFLVS